VCILYCGIVTGFVVCGCVGVCSCGICNVWFSIYLEYVKSWCVYVWILLGVGVCICGFYNVLFCVSLDFVKCRYVYVWIFYVSVCVYMCI
jgi:hypothetical protein